MVEKLFCGRQIKQRSETVSQRLLLYDGCTRFRRDCLPNNAFRTFKLMNPLMYEPRPLGTMRLTQDLVRATISVRTGVLPKTSVAQSTT